MLPGETILSGAPVLPGVSEFQVLRSNAGWYVGTMCEEGPYSRESGYFKTREEAQSALDVYKKTGMLPNAR